VTDPEDIGREAEQSDWLDRAARVGLVAYGAVYLLIAWLAVQLALGDRSESASPSGALHELAQQPFGRIMVWAVAVGMLLLVVWRLVEAAFGYREERGSKRLRKRVVSGLRAGVYAVLGATAVRVAVGSEGAEGSTRSSRGLTARLLDLPGGRWIVVTVGLGVIGYAGVVAWTGWKEKFAENLETQGKLGNSGAAYLVLGKVGHLAKGAVFAAVGALICYAGFTHQPKQSGGLDQTMQKVLQQPFGPYLLIAVAVGLACYGLFVLAWARHLDR
jgi:hypothetical protein